MAKGGRYLKKEKKKKGRGKKVALIVVIVLVAVIGCAAAYGVNIYNDIFSEMKYAEFQEKEFSEQDMYDILNYNPDKPDDWDEQQATADAETEETESDGETIEETTEETAAEETEE